MLKGHGDKTTDCSWDGSPEPSLRWQICQAIQRFACHLRGPREEGPETTRTRERMGINLWSNNVK